MFSLLSAAFENMGWIALNTVRESAEYGKERWWRSLRISMLRAWFGCSPNLAVFSYLKKHYPDAVSNGFPDDCGDLTYGETLPGTAYKLLKLMELTPESVVADLGCGRGVVPLTAAAAFGVKAIGCDIVEEYAVRGQKAAEYMKLGDRAEFKVLDFTSQELPEADVYFLSATCLSDKTFAALLKNLHKKAKQGCRVLSISRPMPSELWQMQMKSKVPFTWGEAVIYAYTKK